MADPFIAEIRIFGFNFAPTGWAFCNGQLMSIAQNTALFALLGTMYGGDGRVTFGLPNLQGSAPMFYGQGPGLSDRQIGETGGETTVTLIQSELPTHTHQIGCDAGVAADAAPTNEIWALGGRGRPSAYSADPPNTPMSGGALAPVGGDQPHNNMQPYLTLNFCIALQGIFPSRP